VVIKLLIKINSVYARRRSTNAANFILGELSRSFVVVTSLIDLGRLARVLGKC